MMSILVQVHLLYANNPQNRLQLLLLSAFAYRRLAAQNSTRTATAQSLFAGSVQTTQSIARTHPALPIFSNQ